MTGVLFGSSYYHEYLPAPRLERDLDLMVDAGFTVLRVGESTWASYEPEEGKISFAALATVVDAAAARGLRVIVGTPSYAVPPWLARRYPEVMAQLPSGQVLPYGARQNVDFTNPVYRRHVERVVRAMAERFGDHEGVIGFQVDNEIGVHELAAPAVVDRFRRHVLDVFGSVDAINERWGLTYWSHRLTDLEDLWAPAGNTNPGYALEWARFQAGLTVEFLAWQRDLLREHLAPRMFVTHDVVGGDSLGSTAVRGIPAAMDRTAVNLYFPLQDALALPDAPPEVTTPLAPWWLTDRGASTMLWRADMAYSLRGPRGERFAVTEAQAGSIGEHATNVPPYPGQLRLVAHALVARGADLLAYWHWHTLHYGAETYWAGVLGHDLEPGRVFREVAAIGAELGGLELSPLTPDADVAILASRDSLKALQFQPPLLDPGTDRADPHSYHRIFMRCYDAALAAGAQVRIVHDDSEWDECRVLVVPALYIASDALLERLVAHARSGAHVVLTFRSGYADQWARVRAVRAPGPLRAAVGAGYAEYTTLAQPVALTGFGSGTAEGWADLLEPEGAEVLAGYDHPFLRPYAAITTNAVGAGRMTWLGTLPDAGTAGRLVAWAMRERGVEPLSSAWGELPPSVRVSSARRPDGARLWFVANHSWDPVTVSAPGVELGPWESRVVDG